MSFPFIIILLLAASGRAGKTDTLVVRTTNISSPVGYIDVTIYKNDSLYLSANSSFKECRVHLDGSATNGICDITFILPHGDYAFVTYHDLNSNGKLDLNFIGYPKEPFAFSRSFRPTVRAPRFEEISYTCKCLRDTLIIPLPK